MCHAYFEAEHPKLHSEELIVCFQFLRWVEHILRRNKGCVNCVVRGKWKMNLPFSLK